MMVDAVMAVAWFGALMLILGGLAYVADTLVGPHWLLEDADHEALLDELWGADE